MFSFGLGGYCNFKDKDCIENILKQFFDVFNESRLPEHRVTYEQFKSFIKMSDVLGNHSVWKHTCQPERLSEKTPQGDAIV
jgi:hypothetical protein